MSVDERLDLLAVIWDSLDPDDVPLTEAQRAELDRRLDELMNDPSAGIPWEEVARRIRDRLR
jgi:putative addiction module component (TIGR02574 family)